MLLLPNIFIQRSCGKVLFAAADVFVALLVRAILQSDFARKRSQHFGGGHSTNVVATSGARQSSNVGTRASHQISEDVGSRNVDGERSNFWALVWLFNPLAANMSSRGNADAVVLTLVLSVVLLLLRGRVRGAAIVFGTAVHFRIYPIVYAPAFVAFLWLHGANYETTDTETAEQQSRRGSLPSLFSWPRDWMSRVACIATFALLSATVFFCLTGATYAWFGYEGAYVCLSAVVFAVTRRLLGGGARSCFRVSLFVRLNACHWI